MSCYCPIGLNGEMLHHIATRNKNQKQSFSAAPSSLVDVSENVFLMRIEIDKITGSDLFPPSAFQTCAYIYFSSRPLFARSFHVCGDEEHNLKASSSFPVSWREGGGKPLVRFFYAITEQTEIRVTGSLSDGGEEDRRRRVVCCMPSIYTESASLAPGSFFLSLALLILLNTQRRRSNIPPFFFIQLSPLASGRVGPLST